MLKIVLDDYKHNYKTGLRKYFNSYMVSAHLSMFVIMPINMEGRWFWYCFIIIPLIFADIFSIIYGGMENRTLFLCPLSKEQRETYFKTSLWIRISIPMILLGISSSILVVCEQVPLLELFILVVVMLIYVISINICCLIDGKMLPNQTGKMNAGNYYIWNVIIRVSGSVNVIAIITEVINKDDIIWIDGVYIGFITLLQIVALFVAITRYYEPVKQISMDYEVLRGISKNAEKGGSTA